jgi:phosphoenolpyruvate-protein kinase (PTS system EI component)
MFPLISNMMELRQARMILHDVMEDLDEQGIPFNRDIPVGIMIEVPSAALMAKTFTPEVDFFSIGTNDLIQYTLAVDRGNEHVASLYSAAHPAVLSLIKDVLRAANRAGVDVSCCGEMAGELEYIMLLIGMGLRNLSMTPQAIPEVKQLIRSVSLSDCQRVARCAASYDSGVPSGEARIGPQPTGPRASARTMNIRAGPGSPRRSPRMRDRAPGPAAPPRPPAPRPAASRAPGAPTARPGRRA